jgi:hypothetical protein
MNLTDGLALLALSRSHSAWRRARRGSGASPPAQGSGPSGPQAFQGPAPHDDQVDLLCRGGFHDTFACVRRSPRRPSRRPAITTASGGLLGRACAAWYPVACRRARRGRDDRRDGGLRSVRHGRANDHWGEKCRPEPVGTLGLWWPRPRPPPPRQSSEAKQSQTADEQHKRRRHLHGAHEVDGRFCADRRRGGED